MAKGFYIPMDGASGEAAQRPLSLGMISRLFGYTRPYRAMRNWLALCVVLRSVQLPLLALALSSAINGPILSGNWTGTLWAAAGFLAFAGITQFTFHFRSHLALKLGEMVIRDVRQQVFAHLHRMNMSFFNRMPVGRILSRVTGDIESMRVGVQDVLFVSIVQIGNMLVAAVAMLWANWRLFLVVLAIAPILWYLNRAFRQRISRVYRAVSESFSRITSSLAEAISGIRVTQGFVRQDINAGLFSELVFDHSRFNVETARVSGFFLPLLEFNSQFFIAILLVVGAALAFHARHLATVQELVTFFFMAGLFFAPVQALANQYNHALAAMAGAERVFGLLDTQPDWQDAPNAHSLPAVRGDVEFRHVSFEYVPARPVLHNITFRLLPGQMVAMVGHTGCGKSTIINLAAKFYQPTSGQILIDGHPLAEVASESLHRRMGVVLQENFLFTGTVADNIRLGKPDATDEQVIDAARRLDCLDIIESLPEGFNTAVGERGSGISLGQRQLICFCRAMLADPQILMLDEATSSVDAMTEARIQTALARLFSGRTSFVVAHRLSTIRHADLVLVLEHGRIIEMGFHHQLLSLGGTYAELYRQFIRAGQA
jgi:ATP-binding cassette subfamily B protein